MINHCKIEIGTFVFAKSLKSPPWPAKIKKIMPQNIFQVKFIDQKSWAFIELKDLSLFTEENIREIKSYQNKRTNKAINVAIKMNTKEKNNNHLKSLRIIQDSEQKIQNNCKLKSKESRQNQLMNISKQNKIKISCNSLEKKNTTPTNSKNQEIKINKQPIKIQRIKRQSLKKKQNSLKDKQKQIIFEKPLQKLKIQQKSAEDHIVSSELNETQYKLLTKSVKKQKSPKQLIDLDSRDEQSSQTYLFNNNLSLKRQLNKSQIKTNQINQLKKTLQKLIEEVTFNISEEQNEKSKTIQHNFQNCYLTDIQLIACNLPLKILQFIKVASLSKTKKYQKLRRFLSRKMQNLKINIENGLVLEKTLNQISAINIQAIKEQFD